MVIDDTEFFMDSIDIINLIKADLVINHIDYLTDIKDGPKNIQITCPYHANGHERKPSAGIRKTDGVFHCFSCGETHSLPQVISYCFGHDDNGSYGRRWLLTHITDHRQTFGKSYYREKKKGESVNKFVSEEELDNYRWTHPYWAERGIVNDNIIDFFDLGYDRDRQMITFPVRDEDGNCEFVAKRSVKTKFFQYPSGVSKPLYGLYELNKALDLGEEIKTVIVCESMIDCILLWQSGHYAVALNGLGNERQFKQLSKLSVKNLILATDNDKAGKDARKRIRQNVKNKWISEISFPKGIKDIGECSREQVDNILDWRKWI